MLPSLAGEEESGGHVEIVGSGVSGASLVDCGLELVGGGASGGDLLEHLEVVDFGLDVLSGLRSVVS